MTKIKKPTRGRKAKSSAAPKASTIHEALNPIYRAIRPSRVYGSFNVDQKLLVSQQDRMKLLNDCRYVYENVGLVKAAVEEIAIYSVGDSWMPSYWGEDKEWGLEAIKWINSWFEVNNAISMEDYVYNLWLSSVAIDRDGDILQHLTYAADGKYPMIEFIPGHRIGNHDKQEVINYGPFRGYKVQDGVIVNDNGRPIGYNILQEKEEDDQQLPIQDCTLLFEAKYAGQLRGYSPIATSLLDVQDYRTIKNYEKQGIAIASSVGLIEENEKGGIEAGDLQFNNNANQPNPGDPNVYYEYLDGGQIRYFGSNTGASLKQLENNRPGDRTQEFLKNHIIRSIFSAIGIPMEIVWDIAGLGSANTRAILAKVERKVTQRQSTLIRAWNQAVRYGVAKAIKLGYLPSNASDWYRFTPTYPRRPSIDIGRDVNNNINLYKIGAQTLSGIYGEDGANWQAGIIQKATEQKFIQDVAAKAGIDPVLIQQLTPNQVPTDTGTTVEEPPATTQ